MFKNYKNKFFGVAICSATFLLSGCFSPNLFRDSKLASVPNRKTAGDQTIYPDPPTARTTLSKYSAIAQGGSQSAVVFLDATPSTGNDLILYEWRVDGYPMLTGKQVSASFDVGLHDAELAVTNAFGASGSVTFQVKVLATQTTQTIKGRFVQWNLDGKYQVGKFVNGDYWVKVNSVGDVKIKSIKFVPNSNRSIAPVYAASTRNGNMINPLPRSQAQDSRGRRFDKKLGVQYPLILSKNQSLLSSISTIPSDYSELIRSGGVNKPCIRDGGDYCSLEAHAKVYAMEILTVLDRAPSGEALRPAYMGTKKIIYNINWDELVKKLPNHVSTKKPDIDKFIKLLSGPANFIVTGWEHRFTSPTQTEATYTAYTYTPEMFLALAANYPLDKKKKLLQLLVQRGIDMIGSVKLGQSFYGEGGHNYAQKILGVIANWALNGAFNSVLKNNPYAEDSLTYFGTDGSGLYGQDCSTRVNNFQAMCNGSYKRGAKDCRPLASLKLNVDSFTPGYSKCNAYQGLTWSGSGKGGYAGQALAIDLLGIRTFWQGDGSFFSYVKRAWKLGYKNSAFVSEMAAYGYLK